MAEGGAAASLLVTLETSEAVATHLSEGEGSSEYGRLETNSAATAG